MDKVCIAGKNNIAVEAVEYILNIIPKENLYLIGNSTDNCQDNWQRSLKKFAVENNLTLVEQKDIYEIENLLFISLEFDKIIKPEKFKTSRIFNIHFSLLPKYKGMYTSIWPILNDEQFTGVTLHRIDAGIDTGEIIAQQKFEIGIDDTARVVYSNYLKYGLELFKQNFENLLNDIVISKPQPSLKSSYYSKASISFSEVNINLNQTAYQILNQVRAFTFPEYQLPKLFGKPVYKSEITSDKSTQKPGNLTQETEEYLRIATIDYDVKVFIDYTDVLFKAAETGETEQLKKVLKFIPDIDITNKNGWTALIIASYHHHVEVARILIEKGANLNATNQRGTTVLMYAKSGATKYQDLSYMEWLVSQGADISAKDKSGKDLLQYAELENNAPVINFIKGYLKKQH